MSLSTQVAALATAVGSDVKSILAKIGTIGDLTTTQKANLVVALNELKAGLTQLESELGAQISDSTETTTTTWSSSKINATIKAAVAALIGGAPETLDTLKELADAIEANKDTIEALQSISAGHVKYDGAQSLSAEQQAQARTNIGAASQTELTTVKATADAANAAATTNTASIGVLSSLTTTAKGNLVAAVNEVKSVADAAKSAADGAAQTAANVNSDLQAFKAAVGDTAADFAGTYTTARDSAS